MSDSKCWFGGLLTQPWRRYTPTFLNTCPHCNCGGTSWYADLVLLEWGVAPFRSLTGNCWGVCVCCLVFQMGGSRLPSAYRLDLR